MTRSTPSLPSGIPPLGESARLFDGPECRYRIPQFIDTLAALDRAGATLAKIESAG